MVHVVYWENGMQPSFMWPEKMLVDFQCKNAIFGHLNRHQNCGFKKIEELFKNAFYGQLIYDGIIIDFADLSAQIGKLDFLPTDNDRKQRDSKIIVFGNWIIGNTNLEV